MNPFCLKLDFLRNRLRVICFWFLRYAFFSYCHAFRYLYAYLLVIEVSQVQKLLKFRKWFKYGLKGRNLSLIVSMSR